jgi:GNAT superfamily N-acetyltransferase
VTEKEKRGQARIGQFEPGPVSTAFSIRPAREADVGAVLNMIRALAEFERLSHLVVATEADLHASLFGPAPAAEVLVACDGATPAGFALFFHNYSTFLGRPGIYLEDLFVKPEMRGHGFGKALLTYLAKLATERKCGRVEWSVLDWNTPAIGFYQKLGAVAKDEWTVHRLTGEALDRLAEEF